MPSKRTQCYLKDSLFKRVNHLFATGPHWMLTLDIKRACFQFCPCFASLILTHSRPLRLACLSHQRTACTLLSGPCRSAAKDKCLRPSPESCRSTWYNTSGSSTSAHGRAWWMALYDVQNGHQLSEKGFEQSLLDTQTRQVPGGLISVVKNKLEVLGKE